jgi:hypothetical protein
MEFYSLDELKKKFGESVIVLDGTYARDFKNILAGEKKGTPLWKYCLIFVLIFLLVETLLLRLWAEKKPAPLAEIKE